MDMQTLSFLVFLDKHHFEGLTLVYLNEWRKTSLNGFNEVAQGFELSEIVF